MATLNVNLGTANVTVGAADNADIINITALGSHTLTVDGTDTTIGSIVGIQAAALPTFAATNGGSLTISQGLLAVNALTALTFDVGDASSIELDASTISVGALEGLLNTYTVNYSGASDTGTFTYRPADVSVLGGLAPVVFTVTGMEATDAFIVEGRPLTLDTDLLGAPESAYYDGLLHLEYPGGLLGQAVDVNVPMTQAEADLFFADPAAYLEADTFTFPGTLAAPCFAAGTLIATRCGPVAIGELRVGDLVRTRDNGDQPIRWIGSRRLDGIDLAMAPHLRPIRIRAGALGANRPSSDLLVSPQHRILVRSPVAQRMLGAATRTSAARQLLQLDGVELAEDVAEVDYVHMLFDRHEIVLSNGAETESLFTGPEALKSVGRRAREEIFALFPELRDEDHAVTAARPLVSGRHGRKLAARHQANAKPLVSA